MVPEEAQARRRLSGMRTLGIDLASAAATTAACAVEWGDGPPRLVELRQANVSDHDIVALAKTATVTGIDAPFGWPRPFARAVAAYDAGKAWPGERSDALWFRTTDVRARAMAGGRPPLSVSSDRIARPAVRAARLLADLGPGRPAARDGADGIVEVYPAGAMRCWSLVAEGYKRPDAIEVRAVLVAGLVAAIGLVATDADRLTLSLTDHAVDALVAALVARAFSLGLVVRPEPDIEDLARVEGWLFLPTGSLADLVGATAPMGAPAGLGVES